MEVGHQPTLVYSEHGRSVKIPSVSVNDSSAKLLHGKATPVRAAVSLKERCSGFDGIEMNPRQSVALKLAEMSGESASSFQVEQEGVNMINLTREERKSVVSELARSGVFSDAPLGTQRRARALILSAWWQVVLGLLAITDAVLLVQEVRSGIWLESRPFDWSWKGSLELIVATAFAAHVANRVAAMGWLKFKSRHSCLFDLLIATGCLMSDISFSVMQALHISLKLQYYDFMSIQAWRLLRIGRLLWMRPFTLGFRHLVSENRRRFIDFMEDFDLDLTYVTPRIIAMGLPTDKFLMGCFRNRLSEVARFLDSRHRDRYLVVNCCPELPYDCTAFKTGSVIQFDIQDHVPPKMSQFIEFVVAVQRWMKQDPRNVLAVHCKAGKGRTGCMVASWLLYSRLCAELEDALAVYALARTDILRVGRLQGVETPSQVRYLKQFEQLLLQQTAYVNVLPRPPPEPMMRLKALRFQHVWAAPAPDVMRAAVHVTHDGRSTVHYWSIDFNSSFVEVPLPCSVAGDVRISIFNAKALDQARASQGKRGRQVESQRQQMDVLAPAFLGDVLCPRQASIDAGGISGKRCIAGKEPGCLFFLLFHTAFLEGSGELQMRIGATEKDPGVDKAFKKAKQYHMDGHITLQYSTDEAETR